MEKRGAQAQKATAINSLWRCARAIHELGSRIHEWGAGMYSRIRACSWMAGKREIRLQRM